jgi:protein-L-isoaspartate(D-aspartate) O-methyltransferase
MRHACVSLALLVALSLHPALAAPAEDAHATARARMVTQQLEARGISDAATLAAMRNVPRHEFVPEARRGQAYADGPLPIGFGQTISQPYIVAYMTELLRLEPGMRVLEIGTGSGYQAAVLGEILEDVCTIEIVRELAIWGEDNLRRAGYEHVRVKQADGYFGWEEFAPFDAIVVTAAADHVPPPLVAQLRDGGRMVIPVGSPFHTQMLMLVTRDGDDIRTENLIPVRFVPFTRAAE